MNTLEGLRPRNTVRKSLLLAACETACLILSLSFLSVARAAEVPSPSSCILLEKEGKVEIARKGTTTWSTVQVNDTLQPGDRLRTGSRSRATLRWAELSVARVNELTSMEIRPP